MDNKEKVPEEIKEIQNILDSALEQEQKHQEEILQKIKAGCETYKDLQNKLHIISREIVYSDPFKDYKRYFDGITVLINKEKSDLPLAGGVQK